MAKKTPEQLNREFEGRKAKGLAKGGAAYWPNVMANAVLRLVAEGHALDLDALAARIAADGEVADPTVSAASREALARLAQARARAG